MVHNLLECSNSVAEDEVDEILVNYSNISQLKEEYVKDINMKLRTEELQNKSSLMNQNSESICQSFLIMNQNWTYTHLKVNF